MKSPLVVVEREGFAQRLNDSLAAAGMKKSPTHLAREFNVRSSASPVTGHAVRKWMFGEAIPTQDRLLILAEILETTPHWLRFGEGAGKEKLRTIRGPVPREIALMFEDIRRLDSSSRDLLDTLVQKMLNHQEALTPNRPSLPSATMD